MAVGSFLRVSWICLLLFSGSLAFPSMKGAGNQGGGAVEFGQEKDFKPVTFPLNPTYPLEKGYDVQLGSKRPQFTSVDVSYDPSTTQSSKPGSSGFPSSDMIPPAYQSTNSIDAAIAQTFEAEPVSGSSDLGYFQNVKFHGGIQDGSQSFSPNLVNDVHFQYSSAEDAELPSKEVGPFNYDFVNAVQPSTWPSASYVTKEEPVFSSNSANWAHAPTSTSIQTLEAEATSSSGIKSADFGSSQNLNFQVGVKDGSQNYSPTLIYEDVFKYPSAEKAELPSKEVGHYDYVNAVQPSKWSSAYVAREEKPVFSSNSANWAKAAHVSKNAETLEAEVTSSSGTKGSGFGSSQNLNFQAAIQDASSYSPKLDIKQYPSPKNAKRPFKKGGASWAQAYPAKSPGSLNHVTDWTLDAAQPLRLQSVNKPSQLPSTQQLEMPQKVSEPFPSTYTVQSKSGYRRSRRVYSKTKYSSSVSQPAPVGLKGPNGDKQ